MTADAVGGVWQYATDLCAALAPLGIETVLAVLGPTLSPEQRVAAATLPATTLVETGLPLDWLCDDAAPVAAAGETIRKLARSHGATLIHYNSPTLAAADDGALPSVAVTHGCVATWWEAARVTELDPGLAWHRAMMAAGLAAVDIVVAPSRAYAETIARHYSLADRPAVVHNGRTAVPANVSGALPDQALTVGRLWDDVKNAALLDRAAAHASTPIAAAGAVTGPRGEHIELNHLQLLGQLSDAALRETLAARPVFVSAATFEPFGLAVLEAAQAGCALLLSDIPTFRELWDGAANFVSGTDPAEWARALDGLTADHPRRVSLGAAAEQRARRYTPTAAAAALDAVYDTALAHHASRSKVAA